MVTTFLSGYEIKPTEVSKLIEKILILLFNFLFSSYLMDSYLLGAK